MFDVINIYYIVHGTILKTAFINLSINMLPQETQRYSSKILFNIIIIIFSISFFLAFLCFA